MVEFTVGVRCFSLHYLPTTQPPVLSETRPVLPRALLDQSRTHPWFSLSLQLPNPFPLPCIFLFVFTDGDVLVRPRQRHPHLGLSAYYEQ